MTSVILSAILILSGTGYALAQNEVNNELQNSLSVTEKTVIAKSIKSYEVKNMNAIDSKTKITSNQLSIDFKGEQYDLRLFEDENLNNAKYYVEINGKDILQKSTDIAYTGYVVGESGSKVSLIVSDNSVSGFIVTAEKDIAIEPLSFYGEEFSGEKQIMYDKSDLDFEFSLDGDVESSDNESKTTETSWLGNGLLPVAEANSGHLADLRIVTDDDYYNINTSTCGTRVLTIVGGMNTAYADTDATMNLLAYTCNVSYLTSSSTPGNRSQLDDQWDNSSSPSRDLVLGLLGGDKDYAHIGSADPSIPGIDNSQYQGYAVAQMVDDSASNYGASLTEQKILASHETGHVMGATHENGKVGGDYTIMSTEVIDESNFTFEFHSNSETEINDAADDYL